MILDIGIIDSIWYISTTFNHCGMCRVNLLILTKQHISFFRRVMFYFVDVNKVPQAVVKRGNISVSQQILACVRHFINLKGKFEYLLAHNDSDIIWQVYFGSVMAPICLCFNLQKMPTIQVTSYLFAQALHLSLYGWNSEFLMMMLAPIHFQLWKDGEWKEEVIGGHKAWLVMDEVREMIQKYKWLIT